MYGRKEVEELADDFRFIVADKSWDKYTQDLLNQFTSIFLKLDQFDAEYVFDSIQDIKNDMEYLFHSTNCSNETLFKVQRFISWAEHGFEERGVEDDTSK